MTRIFAITTPQDNLKLQPGASAKGASFTITNNSDRPLKAQIKLRPQDDTEAAWLSLAGEDTCELTASGTEQTTVNIQVPTGTQPGKYTFRIDVVSVANPDEEYTEGPTVNLDVQPSTEPKKPFPWWIVAVAAVVLGVGGTLGWILTRKVTVPEVVGLSTESASLALAQADLTYSSTEETTSAVTPGEVIDQAPEAGEKVTKDSEVALTIAVAPETTQVPNVLGLSYLSARRQLLQANLEIGNIFGTEIEGNVLRIRPGVGEEVQLGTRIDITMPGGFGLTDPAIILEQLPLQVQEDINDAVRVRPEIGN